MRQSRERLLAEWWRYLVNAAHGGAFGRVIPIERSQAIAGPRAGALEIGAGMHTGRLLQALSKNDAAVLRQFIPWQFAGEPVAYMSGRALRIEAGWPAGLAETMIRLADLGQNPKGGGRWVAGRNERGRTVVAGLSDRTPHFLVSGATGSGKSVALRSAVLQLSADPDNQLVLVDGKYGESLGALSNLRGVVGPVATDGPTMRAALGWICEAMRHRYETGDKSGRLVLIFDEFQEAADDPTIVDLLRKLAAQGRAAGVHAILATQHPTVAAFGDSTTRRNLTGKLALRVSDPDASRVAVGGRLPRADWLLGAGDAYTVAPGACHRVQTAYVDDQEIGAAETGQRRFEEWPEFDAGAMGQELPEVKWAYSGNELAHSLVSAVEQEGRPSLVGRLDAAGLGRPGSDRAARLLKLGRETYSGLLENDWDLCAL